MRSCYPWCMSNTQDAHITPQVRYSVEFQAPCPTCGRPSVDVLSRRVVDGSRGAGRDRGEPGLVYARHARGTLGTCEGSMSDHVRGASSHVGGVGGTSSRVGRVGAGAPSRNRAKPKPL